MVSEKQQRKAGVGQGGDRANRVGLISALGQSPELSQACGDEICPGPVATTSLVDNRGQLGLGSRRVVTGPHDVTASLHDPAGDARRNRRHPPPHQAVDWLPPVWSVASEG